MTEGEELEVLVDTLMVKLKICKSGDEQRTEVLATLRRVVCECAEAAWDSGYPGRAVLERWGLRGLSESEESKG